MISEKIESVRETLFNVAEELFLMPGGHQHLYHELLEARAQLAEIMRELEKEKAA